MKPPGDGVPEGSADAATDGATHDGTDDATRPATHGATHEAVTVPSGLARSLRDRFQEVAGPPPDRREPSESGTPPGSTLPPGTRDRFTTQVARYLTGSPEVQDRLLPVIREDLRVLEGAGALGVIAEAARSVLRARPPDDPLARLLSGRS